MITLVTSNLGKVRELSKLLGREISHQAIDLVEIQSLDTGEVARRKAQEAYDIVKSPVVIDDSGFTIEAWGKLPGALAKYFLSEIGVAKIAEMVGYDRQASVETALAYCDENGVEVFVGRVIGAIADKPRGVGGFGYDPIFIANGQARTLAEIPLAEKNRISSRALAAEKLKEYLDYKLI